MAVRKIDWPDDVSALARSLSRAVPAGGGWFWLDGEAAEPAASLAYEWRGSRLSYLGVAAEVQHAARGREREFLSALRAPNRDFRSFGDFGSGVVSPAQWPVGWVIALSYEFGVALLGEQPAHDDASPAIALRADTMLVLDHARGVAELRGPSERAIDEWLEQHGEASDGRPARAAMPGGENAASWRRSDSDYLAEVEACQRAIRNGDAYVLCLTDTIEAAATGVDSLKLYLHLRDAGLASRGAVISAGDRALVSVSPERFLSKWANAIATHPIKGTRPRGATPECDAELATELAADPKERAENLMIVDLMRNDLSRVCEPGTVRTEAFLRVETHPSVHQLVSTVIGELREGLDLYDAIEACFPGGSMTGAPKRRAVQLLAEFERAPRGLYSGCFGWVGTDGDAELAMTIRSVELRGLGTPSVEARIGAGGGVTADSMPDAELAEKQLKAAPLVAALEASATRYD